MRSPRTFGEAKMGRSKWIILLGAGIVVALGVVAFRLRERSPGESTSSAQSVNRPSPSASSGASPAAAPSLSIDEFLRTTIIRSFQVAVEANQARFREMATSRLSTVMQGGDAGQRSMLRPKDVAEFRQKLRALIESVDNGLGVFAEAQAKGISLSGVGNNALESNPEAWRLFLRYWVASERFHSILEENWEEYYEFGAEAPADKAKPWQQEAMRAQAEMNASQKEIEKLSTQTR